MDVAARNDVDAICVRRGGGGRGGRAAGTRGSRLGDGRALGRSVAPLGSTGHERVVDALVVPAGHGEGEEEGEEEGSGEGKGPACQHPLEDNAGHDCR